MGLEFVITPCVGSGRVRGNVPASWNFLGRLAWLLIHCRIAQVYRPQARCEHNVHYVNNCLSIPFYWLAMLEEDRQRRNGLFPDNSLLLNVWDWDAYKKYEGKQ